MMFRALLASLIALNSLAQEPAILSDMAAASAQPQGSVTLAWDPSPNGVVYRLYQGLASGSYTTSIDVGNVTQYTVSGLNNSSTYYFAVSALDNNGVESDLSNEISYVASNSLPVVALTSPVDGTTYPYAPATLLLTATVTNNGHTISKVEFYDGAALLGQVLSAPYSFTWDNVGIGSYSVTARVWYDSISTVVSAPVTFTVLGLAPPWQGAGIGNVDVSGSAAVSGGVFSVAGAGIIGGSDDTFQFVYQAFNGDGEIVAQISSVQNAGPNGIVGVMIRESLTSDSEYLLMGASTDGNLLRSRRNNTGGNSHTTILGWATPPNVWVRMVRRGTLIDRYWSVDGTTWTLSDSRNITMAGNAYIGLAVASGDPGMLNTSTFSNVYVAP